MSLARTLMGANNAVVTESVDVTGYDFSEKVMMESSWVDAACESLFTDIYNVDKAFAVADVMGEVQVMTEGANPEVVLEAIVKGGIEKLKDAFKKFWAKLKAWFAKIKDHFKKIFMHGKKFVTEFEKKIKDKARAKDGMKGFKYTAFKYDFAKGDSAADGLFGDVEKKVNGLLDLAEGVSYKYSTDDLIAETLKKQGLASTEAKAPSSSEMQDEFCKGCSVKGADISEVTTKLEELYRSGEDQMEEFEEFETASIDEMIDFIKTFDKKVSEIEKAERAFEKQINSIIKTLDNVKKNDDKTGGDKGYKVAQKLSGYMSALLTVGKVPSTVKAAAYREAAGVYERVLKSFLSFKPVKEGAEAEVEGEEGVKETSLFESAYNFI